MTLTDILKDFYKRTGRVFPNFDRSLQFADTEKAEALEIYLAKFPEFKRNHPEDKPKWLPEKLEMELGQMIQMIQVAGMAEGVDPLAGLIRKLSRQTDVKYILDGIGYE